ncbi:MAG TPA: hypothetical protein PKA63_07190 [Oligoflexia bacterium]|nr:hypothetical protein [Oligoflexia bacterium]HMP48433.1 hypothetical protein [Oligoflexia bacterium]
MRKVLCLFIVPVLMAVAGCGGGGGGGGSSTPFFGGVYNVSLIKVSDTCGLNTDNIVSFTHTVNQDGRRVLLDSGSVVLQGRVTDDNKGFDVTNREESGGCVTSTAVVYRPTEQSGADYGVGLALLAVCGADRCELSYGGTAKRRP